MIAATHRDLPKRCEEGNFRWDLYYRLAVVELRLPALLERGAAEIKTMPGALHRFGKEGPAPAAQVRFDP